MFMNEWLIRRKKGNGPIEAEMHLLTKDLTKNIYHPAGEQTLCRRIFVMPLATKMKISTKDISLRGRSSNTSDGYEEGWGGISAPWSNEKSAGAPSAAWQSSLWAQESDRPIRNFSIPEIRVSISCLDLFGTIYDAQQPWKDLS
ncbi:uncharacterized protein EAE98_008070 [Botrytis deweyae]|uniref:Uncharacterized protein n=1 Tax=Botrytis deweyae TaxID=2478750 RepID=A0ABQ7IFJ3_9HELO|nr:uncharacterized protein EAE98_008070 [Botrytis deweyae]KAF7922544.1 hypothetical protein EAE98_008070 [Botrytis deweyae]